MPRELVHWYVVEQAAKRFGLSFNEPHARAMLYLGAMSPDAPYYLGGGGAPETRYGELLHGAEGEDTFQFIRTISERLTPEMYPFVLGYLSHIATDAVLHPAVYYLTGDYYALDSEKRKRARSQHWAMEVALERAIEPRYAPSWKEFREVFRTLDQRTKQLTPILDKGIGCELWEKAFLEMSRYQRLFRSPIFGGATVRVIGQLSSLKHMRGLFSSYQGWPHIELDAPWEYRCVVTGEECRASFRDLLERSIEKTITWWRDGRSAEPTTWTPKEVGPSLNTGLVGTTRESLKYFEGL